MPATAIAPLLSRPPEQVSRRRRLLLGGAPRGIPYTPVEDNAITLCWADGRDVAALARELGRPAGSLRLRAQKLGLQCPAPRARWRPYEDVSLRDGYERGLTCAQIAIELAERTPSAIAARAGKLGLATYARTWTPREDRDLRRLSRDGFELERAASSSEPRDCFPALQRRCGRVHASSGSHLRYHVAAGVPASLDQRRRRAADAALRTESSGARRAVEPQPPGDHPAAAAPGATRRCRALPASSRGDAWRLDAGRTIGRRAGAPRRSATPSPCRDPAPRPAAGRHPTPGGRVPDPPVRQVRCRTFGRPTRPSSSYGA